MTATVTLVPGDSIGPEVTHAIMRLLEAAGHGKAGVRSQNSQVRDEV
jgi:isocitrate/isopropylmalate dehydrogenase